jgi:hypothetical protein
MSSVTNAVVKKKITYQLTGTGQLKKIHAVVLAKKSLISTQKHTTGPYLDQI